MNPAQRSKPSYSCKRGFIVSSRPSWPTTMGFHLRASPPEKANLGHSLIIHRAEPVRAFLFPIDRPNTGQPDGHCTGSVGLGITKSITADFGVTVAPAPIALIYRYFCRYHSGIGLWFCRPLRNHSATVAFLYEEPARSHRKRTRARLATHARRLRR